MNNNEAVQTNKMDYWKKIIILLCLGWVVIWIYRTTLTPLYSEIQKTIGEHSATEMGLIASCYFFGYTGMQIPAGMLVDRIGKRKVLIPGFTLFAIAAIVIGSASSLMMIYIGSALAGIGCGSYYGAAYSLSSQVIPAERKTLSTAIINSGSAIGMGVGLIGSSFLVKSAGLYWGHTLYIVAALIIMMVIAFAIIIKKEDAHKVEVSKVEKVNDNEVVNAEQKLFSPSLVSSYFLYFATCYGYYMIVTWLPTFLQDERGFQGSAIGMASSLVAFASIPGALYFSSRSDKFSHRKVQMIIFLQISAAAMLALIVLAPSTTVLLGGLILYGLLGKLAVDPILISFISDNANKKSLGTSLGVFNFFGMSSSVLAPVITGFISDTTGSKELGFYTSVILIVIAVSIFALFNIKKKKTQMEG